MGLWEQLGLGSSAWLGQSYQQNPYGYSPGYGSVNIPYRCPHPICPICIKEQSKAYEKWVEERNKAKLKQELYKERCKEYMDKFHHKCIMNNAHNLD